MKLVEMATEKRTNASPKGCDTASHALSIGNGPSGGASPLSWTGPFRVPLGPRIGGDFPRVPTRLSSLAYVEDEGRVLQSKQEGAIILDVKATQQVGAKLGSGNPLYRVPSGEVVK